MKWNRRLLPVLRRRSPRDQVRLCPIELEILPLELVHLATPQPGESRGLVNDPPRPSYREQPVQLIFGECAPRSHGNMTSGRSLDALERIPSQQPLLFHPVQQRTHGSQVLVQSLVRPFAAVAPGREALRRDILCQRPLALPKQLEHTILDLVEVARIPMERGLGRKKIIQMRGERFLARIPKRL